MTPPDDLRQRCEALCSHFQGDDCWYNCPLSSDGCCDESKPKDKCTCGYEITVQRFIAFARAERAAVWREAVLYARVILAWHKISFWCEQQARELSGDVE